MLRFLPFQFLKQLIHRIFKFFIIFPGFRCVDQFQERRKVLFFLRSFIINVADQRTIQKPLSFHPKILRRFFAFPFGIGNNGIHQLQNVFLTADIHEGIVMHTFFKIDGI